MDASAVLRPSPATGGRCVGGSLFGEAMRRRAWSLVAVVGAFLVACASFASAQPKRVAVPRVHGTEVSAAYRQLHRAGFRVTIRHPFALSSLSHGYVYFPVTVVRTEPAPGRLVREGSVVTVFLRCECRPGHTLEPRHKPAYEVPAFTGGFLGAAYRWARPKVLVFEARLGSLHAGDARTLFANYQIDQQSPRPGTSLRYSNRDGGWTPLRVWAHQIG